MLLSQPSDFDCKSSGVSYLTVPAEKQNRWSFLGRRKPLLSIKNIRFRQTEPELRCWTVMHSVTFGKQRQHQLKRLVAAVTHGGGGAGTVRHWVKYDVIRLTVKARPVNGTQQQTHHRKARCDGQVKVQRAECPRTSTNWSKVVQRGPKFLHDDVTDWFELHVTYFYPDSTTASVTFWPNWEICLNYSAVLAKRIRQRSQFSLNVTWAVMLWGCWYTLHIAHFSVSQ